MSGLKYRIKYNHTEHIMSHPVWDEWIEMIWYRCKASIHNRSHPVWDEWIEISIFTMKKSKR